MKENTAHPASRHGRRHRILSTSCHLLRNWICSTQPLTEQVASSAKVVFLTVHDDRDFVEAAMSAGALGYILKQRLAADLILGLKTVLDGDTFVSSSTILQ